MDIADLTDHYALPATSVDQHHPGRYLAVSKRKLIIMLIGTFGGYGVYWSYRQWKAYSYTTGGKQWAWARAFFFRLFAHNLFSKLDDELGKTGVVIKWPAHGSGCLLFVVEICAVMTFFLNDLHALLPVILLWAITAAMFANAVPVANALANDPQGKSNDELGGTNIAWLMFGAVWWMVFIWSALTTFMNPDAFT